MPPKSNPDRFVTAREMFAENGDSLKELRGDLDKLETMISELGNDADLAARVKRLEAIVETLVSSADGEHAPFSYRAYLIAIAREREVRLFPVVKK